MMKISNKFGAKSVFYKKTYYFPNEINADGYITVIYYDRGKWIQSRQKVDQDLKEKLIQFYNKN